MKFSNIKNEALLSLTGRILLGIAGFALFLFVWLSLGSIPVTGLVRNIIVEQVTVLPEIKSVEVEKVSLKLDPVRFRPKLHFGRTKLHLRQNGTQIDISDLLISFRLDSILSGAFIPAAIDGDKVALKTDHKRDESAPGIDISEFPNEIEPILQSISFFESPLFSDLEIIEFNKISIPKKQLPGKTDLEIVGLVQLVTKENGFEGSFFYPDDSVEAKVKWRFNRYQKNQETAYKINLVGDTKVLSEWFQTGVYQPESYESIDYGTVLIELNTNKPYDQIQGSINLLDLVFISTGNLTPLTIDSLGVDFQYAPKTGTFDLDTINLRSDYITTMGEGSVHFRTLNEGLEVFGKATLESFLTEQRVEADTMNQSGEISFSFLIPSENQNGSFNIEGEFTGLGSEQQDESFLSNVFQENSLFSATVSGELGDQRNIDTLRGKLSWVNDISVPGEELQGSRIEIPFQFEQQKQAIVSKGLFFSLEEYPFALEGEVVMNLTNSDSRPSYAGEISLREKSKNIPLPAPIGKVKFSAVSETFGYNINYDLTVSGGLFPLGKSTSPAMLSNGKFDLKTLPEGKIDIKGSIEAFLELEKGMNKIRINFDGASQGQAIYFKEFAIHSDPISIFSTGRITNLSNDEDPITGEFEINRIELTGLENRISIGTDEDITFAISLGEESVTSEITAPVKFLSTFYNLQANKASGQFDYGDGVFTFRTNYHWLTSLLEGEFNTTSLMIPHGGNKNNLPIDKFNLAFRYPLNSRESGITIDHLIAESDLFTAKASGSFFSQGSNFGQDFVGNILLEYIQLKDNETFDSSLKRINGNIDLKFDGKNRELRIAQFYFDEGGAQFWGKGSLFFDKGSELGSIHFWTRDLSKFETMKFWPLNFVSNTRSWFLKNIHNGVIEELTGGITLYRNSKPKLNATYTFSDVDFTYLKGFPPIIKGNGFATLTERDFSLQMDEGYTEVFKKGVVTLDGSRFYIPDITNNKIPSEVYLKVNSKIYPLFELLDLDPFNFISKANLTPVFVSGDASGEIKINFPLIQKIPQDQINYEGFGEFTAFETIGLFYGKIFQAEKLDIKFDNQLLVIGGEGNFGNLPINATMTQSFEPNVSERLNISGSFNLTDAFFEEFNIDFIPDIVSGSSVINFNLGFPSEAPPYMRLDSDLYGTGIEIPVIDWAKPSEERGSLFVGASISSPLDINAFKLNAPGLATEGRLNLNADGGFESFYLNQIEMAGFYSGELVVSLDENGTIELEIPGTIELGDSNMLAQYSSNDETDQEFSFYLGELKISPRFSITDINGLIQRDEDVRANFNGKMNGGATLNGWLFDREGTWMLRIASDNAGQVARDAELIKTLRGGKVWVDINPGEGEGEFHGTIIISDITIPRFYELGRSVEDESVIESEEEIGIPMDQIRSDFNLTKERLFLNDAAGIGTQVGFSFSGDFDLQAKTMNFEGTVAPLRVITTLIKIVNPISLLVPRRISGEIGTFDFTLTGTLANPDFEIEPTSVINPSNLTGFLFLNIAP